MQGRKQIIHTSWGYNMTHNDYALVLENTGKTVKCVLIGSKLISGGGYTGEEIPNPDDVISKPFRLRIKKGYQGKEVFSGSYYFIKNNDSKRKGLFYKWNGNPNYYNTID